MYIPNMILERVYLGTCFVSLSVCTCNRVCESASASWRYYLPFLYSFETTNTPIWMECTTYKESRIVNEVKKVYYHRYILPHDDKWFFSLSYLEISHMYTAKKREGVMLHGFHASYLYFFSFLMVEKVRLGRRRWTLSLINSAYAMISEPNLLVAATQWLHLSPMFHICIVCDVCVSLGVFWLSDLLRV